MTRGKLKRTHMIYSEQDEWINQMSENLGVNKSFIARRAIEFYAKKGIKQDTLMREKVGEPQLKKALRESDK